MISALISMILFTAQMKPPEWFGGKGRHLAICPRCWRYIASPAPGSLIGDKSPQRRVKRIDEQPYNLGLLVVCVRTL